jgi:hypothetical protein
LDCLEQARALEQLPVRLVSLCNQEPWVGQFHREIEQALRAVFAAAEQATPLCVSTHKEHWDKYWPKQCLIASCQIQGKH